MQTRLTQIFYLLIFVIFLLPTISVAQHSIGVSSTVINLGTLERGSDNVATFYLVTASSESFLVSLNKEPAASDFFSRVGYGDYLFNYSEEGVIEWVELFRDDVRIEPVEGGGIIGAQKEVNFIVSVPEDAEPGYHIFRIKPLPVLSPEAVGQVGAVVVSATAVTFLFDIEGTAIRDGIILDVVPGTRVGNKFAVNVYFQNTGTTTISAIAKQTIYKNGEIIANSVSSRELVSPGEVKVLRVLYAGNKFSEGDYEVRTSVDFLSGSVSKNSTISVLPSILPPVEEKPKFPWLLIVLILIILVAIIIYKIS